MKTIILSFDPGKYNFAYSFLNPDGKLIKTGMLTHRMTDLKNIKEANNEINGFISESKDLVKNKKLRIVFERFVPRGSNYRGNLVEITCMKIGLLLATLKMSNDCYIIPILAATWKNFYNKNNLWIVNDSIPEHISDAMSMGYYYLLKKSKITISQVKKLVKEYNSKNFGWYMYKNEWFFGKRKQEHFRGKRNSFGN